MQHSVRLEQCPGVKGCQRVRINGAHAAGREAGRTVVLHKPVERGASAGAPRLLRG